MEDKESIEIKSRLHGKTNLDTNEISFSGPTSALWQIFEIEVAILQQKTCKLTREERSKLYELLGILPNIIDNMEQKFGE